MVVGWRRGKEGLSTGPTTDLSTGLSFSPSIGLGTDRRLSASVDDDPPLCYFFICYGVDGGRLCNSLSVRDNRGQRGFCAAYACFSAKLSSRNLPKRSLGFSLSLEFHTLKMRMTRISYQTSSSCFVHLFSLSSHFVMCHKINSVVLFSTSIM